MSPEPSPEQAELLARLRRAHHEEALPRGIERRLLAHFEAGFEPRAQDEARYARWGTAFRRSMAGHPPLLAFAALVLLVGAAMSARAWMQRELRGAQVGPEPFADPPFAPAQAPAEPARAGARPCPQAEVPSAAAIAPAEVDFGVERAGLSVHTLDQPTPSCGRITRRYVERLPRSLAPNSGAPIVLALHDTGLSAEAMRADRRLGRLDEEAERNGFILVYANGAPGERTEPAIMNSGGWQSDANAHLEVDDEDYLDRVVRDLATRGVANGHNAVFLVGHGGGAAMALTAAADRPDRYAGVVAVLPLPGDATRLVPRSATLLSRVMFVLGTQAWPGTAARRLAAEWAAALRISQPPSEARWMLPSAGAPWRVEQLDREVPASGAAAVRVLLLHGVESVGARLPPNDDGRLVRELLAFLNGADATEPAAAEHAPFQPMIEDDLAGDFVAPMRFDEDVLRQEPDGRR